jgi:hypothetical protein
MRYAYSIFDKTITEMTTFWWNDHAKIDLKEDARAWADTVCHEMEFVSMLWPN